MYNNCLRYSANAYIIVYYDVVGIIYPFIHQKSSCGVITKIQDRTNNNINTTCMGIKYDWNNAYCTNKNTREVRSVCIMSPQKQFIHCEP